MEEQPVLSLRGMSWRKEMTGLVLFTVQKQTVGISEAVESYAAEGLSV